MSQKPHYFKLGVFVLSATAILVGAIITLGVGAIFKQTIPVETYIDGSVGGLEVGSPAKFRGVTVGRVKSIGFVSEEYPIDLDKLTVKHPPILVKIDLDEDMFKPMSEIEITGRIQAMVKNGLRFRLQSSLTGSTTIEADFLNPLLYPAMKPAWLPKNLYIPSAPSTINQITNALEKLSLDLNRTDVGALLNNVNRLVLDSDKTVNNVDAHGLSQHTIALLDELRHSNSELQTILTSPKVDSTLTNLAGVMDDLHDITGNEKIDIKTFLADLPKVSQNLKETTAKIETILKDPRIDNMLTNLSQASGNANQAAGSLAVLLRDLRTLYATQEQDIRTIVSNLRTVTDNAAEATGELKANPSSLLFSAPPLRRKPGE